METNDKDYIDAKLQAVIERLNGEARAHQIATDARFVQLNQIMEAGFKLLQKDNEIFGAKTEAYLQKVVGDVAKSQSEITRIRSATPISMLIKDQTARRARLHGPH